MITKSFNLILKNALKLGKFAGLDRESRLEHHLKKFFIFVEVIEVGGSTHSSFVVCRHHFPLLEIKDKFDKFRLLRDSADTFA